MTKLGKNIIFPIYRDVNDVPTPFHDLALHRSTSDSIVMSLGDKITGDVYYKNNALDVTMTEYILVKRNPDDANERAVKFVLVNPPTIVREGMVADNSQLKGMTKYSFTFYHPMYMLGNLPFADVAVTDEEKRYLSESKKFNWIGNAQDYVAKLNKNLQGTEFVVRISDTLYNDPETRLSPKEEITRLSDVLTFDDAMIADALKTFYDTYGIPFVIDILPSTDSDYASGKRYLILMGLPSETIVDGQGNEFVFQFGQGVGLKNNSRTPRNNKIVTRVAGFGSEENIPYGYPQIRWYGPSDWTNTKNDESDPTSYPIYEGIVGGELVKLIKHPFTRTHLMPTIYETTVFNKVSPYVENGSANPDYDPDTTLVDYYDATAEKGYPNPINPNAPSYESHEFADIKPQLGHETGITSAVPQKWNGSTYIDDDHWDDTYDPDQDGYIQSYFKIGLPILSFDLYASAAITQQMNVVMRSGACLGCTFPVYVDWDDYKKNFFNADGVFDPVPHTTEGDGHVRDIAKYPDSSQTAIRILAKKENTTFGVVMPNVYQNPTAGDEIVFTGISLPQSYITMAQALLDQAMDDWMMENNVYYWDYPLKFDEYFLSKHTDILAQIRPNVRVSFMFANETLTLYVKQLVIKYGEKVLPQYDITLTDDIEATRNAIGQAQADIGGLHTGLDRIGQAVQEITRKDRIQPSGSPTLPVYVNGNNEFKAIEGLNVPKNVEAGYGVAAYGMASLAMNGGGGQGTVTAINFEGSPERIYTPSDGLITLPDYPSLDGYATQAWVTNNFADKAFEGRVTTIESKIPAQASSTNQLADKNFVNSSVATATAEFQGTYDVVDDLGLSASATHAQIQSALLTAVASQQPDNNDYVFVSIPAVSGASGKYERYKFNGTAWAYEYTLNNSSFTAAQWASITSGITSAKVSDYDTHIARTDNPHGVTKAQVGLGNVENTALSTWTGTIKIVTLGTITTGVWHGSAIADDYIASASAWNAKYDKDPNGIPKTDLASAVQTSLGKADTALQSESDPVFTASAAYGITSANINEWNAKQNALAFDGTYDASTNKVATKSTVTNAINALDVSNISGFGAGKTLASLTETDGKIAATFQNISITKSQVSDFPTTWALANITGADDLKAIEALTGTSGFLKKTAANTWTLDTDVASGTALSGVSTRVGTLEGYFTSGVANNAAQLGGQLPSYYAVAADYTKTSDFQSFSIKVGTTTLGTYSPTSALILSLVAGSNIAFDTDATNHKLTIRNTYSYTLPMASSDSRGGIRVGNTLNIDSNGILNANIYDGLDQGYTTYALSAKQGKALNTALGTLKTGLTSKGAHNLPIYLNSNAQAVAIDALSVSGNVESTAGGVSASGIASLAMNGGGGQGTLTQIQVNGVALADTSGVVNITATTGNAAGKIAIAGQQIPVYGLGSLAYLSSLAFTDLSSHPTTLGGYGITDAKIANGVITLGGNSITPITSLPTFYNLAFQNGNSVVDTYKPTTSPSKTIKAGSNVTISAASNVITIAATDTTYESKAAASGGTAVSLVTTGEKYTWNNKGTYSKPSGGIPATDLAESYYLASNPNGYTKTEASTTNGKIKINGTDTTVYTHPTTAGNKHIPSGGSSGQFLGYDSAGTAKWVNNPNTDTKVTQTVTTSSNTSWRPLLIGQSYSDASPFAPTTTTDTVYATHLAKFAPKDGLLAIRGLNKMNTDGTLATGSEYKVFNTNGGVSNLAAWAQADSKPSYTYSEVGAAASSHTHGNIQNGGTLQTNDVSIANGDKLVITDASDSVKVARSGITFDASTTNKALTPKGTWESFLQGNQTITLSGDVSGSGTTSIAVTIGASKVTNAMLAGSIANNKLANSSISIAGTSVSLGGSISAATLKSNLGLGASAYVGYDTTVTKDSAKLITSGAVWTAIDNLPEPMVFKGSLGTGGTIIALPVNGSASIGDTYKVITAGTYASKAAKVGDTFICLTKTSSANTWELIPSGDEPSGTVTSVGLSMPTGFSVSSSPVTTSGTLTVAFASGYSLPTTAKQGNWDDAYDKRHTHSSLTLSTTAQAYDGTHTLALPASDPYTSARTPSSHASSGTGYGVGTTSNYGHVKLATGDMNGASGADGVACGKNHTHSQYALAANLGTASTHAHGDYVTAIGTSGNTLTWSKGGTAQTAITVPYATTAGGVAWGNVSDKPINLKAYSGSLASGGWATLNGRSNSPSIAISYNNSAASWNSSTYSATMVFGCSDTRGLLDLAYTGGVVTFGGGYYGGSTDDSPTWYWKLKGTSGQTYTLPSTSKTLAATDGSNASGTWGISVTGSAGSVAWDNVTSHPTKLSQFTDDLGTSPTHTHSQYALAANLGTASSHAHTDYVTGITWDSTNRKLKQSKGGGTATDIVTFGAAYSYGVYDKSAATAAGSSGTGLVTERALYYALPTVNGGHSYKSSDNIYAPTGAGTSGQILKSSGSGAPTWANQSTITAGALTTVSKTAWGRTYWTSGGVPDSISGDMSNVGNIAFSASGKNIGGTMYFDTTNHRIGINDSTPSCAFDVTGDVQASGGVAAGGILNLAYNGAGTQGTLTQIQINGRALTDTSGIVNIPLANTTSTGDGAMSHSDKLKLDGIATGATNVNTDTVAGWGYTKNAGTVTGVKMNGSVKGSSGVVDLGTVITDVSGKADKQMNVLVDNNGSATITMTNSTTARYHFVRYPSSSSVTAITLQQATSALTAANCGTAHYELFRNEKSTAITLTLTKYSNSSYYLIAPSKTITIPANSSVELSYIHIAGVSSTYYTVVTIGDVMINVS